MTEIPHSELQKHHYQAVRASMEYRMQGLMDCRQEETMMAMPLTTINETRIIETQWSNKQWGEIDQLKRHILYLSNKIYSNKRKKEQRKYTLK